MRTIRNELTVEGDSIGARRREEGRRSRNFNRVFLLFFSFLGALELLGSQGRQVGSHPTEYGPYYRPRNQVPIPVFRAESEFEIKNADFELQGRKNEN